MKFKNIGIFLSVIVFTSCSSIPEPQKVAEITYYNHSELPIKRIILSITNVENFTTIGKIEINKPILPNDSLIFMYNLENSPSTQTTRVLKTDVYFFEKPQIFDTTYNSIANGYAGIFDINRKIENQAVYISQNAMLFCATEKNFTCNPDILKR